MKYSCYKLNEKHPEIKQSDVLIAENQIVGTGDGYYVTRNLYQSIDGSRFSIQTSKPIYSNEKHNQRTNKTREQKI